jgi:hypothetical protein
MPICQWFKIADRLKVTLCIFKHKLTVHSFVNLAYTLNTLYNCVQAKNGSLILQLLCAR